MPSRSNKHIKKFNQLVEVYDPTGIEPIESVTSRDESRLKERKAEILAHRSEVEQLDLSDFFDESRIVEIRETESLPEPESVADSHREEMLDRLDQVETAISETILDGDILDTAEEFD